MTRGAPRWLTLVFPAALVFLAVVWTVSDGEPQPSPPAPATTYEPAPPEARRLRRERLAPFFPGASRDDVEQLMQRSDEAIGARQAWSRDALAEVLAEAEADVTEADIEAFYDSHRERFGHRTLHEAKLPIIRILTYERAIALLENEPSRVAEGIESEER